MSTCWVRPKVRLVPYLVAWLSIPTWRFTIKTCRYPNGHKRTTQTFTSQTLTCRCSQTPFAFCKQPSLRCPWVALLGMALVQFLWHLPKQRGKFFTSGSCLANRWRLLLKTHGRHRANWWRLSRTVKQLEDTESGWTMRVASGKFPVDYATC